MILLYDTGPAYQRDSQILRCYASDARMNTFREPKMKTTSHILKDQFRDFFNFILRCYFGHFDVCLTTRRFQKIRKQKKLTKCPKFGICPKLSQVSEVTQLTVWTDIQNNRQTQLKVAHRHKNVSRITDDLRDSLKMGNIVHLFFNKKPVYKKKGDKGQKVKKK